MGITQGADKMMHQPAGKLPIAAKPKVRVGFTKPTRAQRKIKNRQRAKR
jgi:hypothetical protein